MEKDTVILVLNNGTQLIASVTEASGAYICTDVLEIVTDADAASGTMRMGLVPFLPFTDPTGGIAVPSATTIVATPSEEILRHYNSTFGKIITPPVQKIIV